MRIALICPSNMMYMPYVSNYTRILDESNSQYDIILWDRFQIEEESEFYYRDSKVGYQRKLFDYFKYSLYIRKLLKRHHYDSIIVFGFQLLFFVNHILGKYKGRYVIDIRDYHEIIHCFNFKKIVSNSAFTVISSPGYKQWLPESNKYVVNHNSQLESIEGLCSVDKSMKDHLIAKDKLIISYIGALREYQQSIDLINALKDSERIRLKFHGEGFVNKDIEKYLKENDIENIFLTGRYHRDQEPELYLNCDFVNALEPNDFINCRTLLSNRLYNAAMYGKPLLVYDGTYQAEIVKKYHLGLVINSFENLETVIFDYLKGFDVDCYNSGRRMFFDHAIRENEEFKRKVNEFIGKKV